MPAPTDLTLPQLDEDTIDDLLYSARTGDTAQLRSDLSALSSHHNATPLSIACAAVDQNTCNTLAHYACANGHLEILKHVISLSSAASSKPTPSPDPVQAHEQAAHLTRPNSSLSTPLHYGALNNQLAAVRLLLDAIPAGEARSNFVSAKNAAGRDAAFEAEVAGADEVVTYLLGVLDEAELEPAGEQMEEDRREEPNSGAHGDDGEEINQIAGDVEGMGINDRQSAKSQGNGV